MSFRASAAGKTAEHTPRFYPNAVTAVAVLTLGACSIGEGDQSSGEEEVKPEGEPDRLTVVDAENVVDIGEEKRTEDGEVAVEIAYPVVPNADPLTEWLGTVTDREAGDFEEASPEAEAFHIDWNLSVASADVIAVRLTQTETESGEEREYHATYWYDTANANTAYSTELLDGQKSLNALNELVKEALEGEEEVRASALHPIMRLYDSIGFNPDGDLVVEFDQGQVAPESEGRISAVIDAQEATPLLSEFGTRAQASATVVASDVQIADVPQGSQDDTAPRAVPGAIPVVQEDGPDCSAAESKCVALTFDDGPGEQTPELLDTLDEHDAKATFFLTGEEPVREYPEIVQREYAEGHEVANHTMLHPDLTSVSRAEAKNELAALNALVRRETGYTMNLMRPPFGASDDTVSEVSEELGLAQILWSVDPYDWRDRDSDKVAKHVMKEVEPGSIVLMHDIHGTTVDAVPTILEELDEEGYTMVTVSQLLGETEPGESYRDGHPEEEEEDEEDEDGEDD